MKKLLYISILSTLLLACADDDVIKGTAVSFYPNLVDIVAEGGTSSASLELTGPGTGTVIVKVSDPEFITTVPAMNAGNIEIVFDGESSKTIDISVARGGRSDDYTVTFDVISVSGGIKDIASGTFKLYVKAIPTLSLPFFDDFESCSEEFATPEKWTEEFVGASKTDRGWGCRATDGLNGTRGVRASAFGGEAGIDHSWLITRGSLDLTSVSEAYLTFDIKSSFSGDGDLFVLWSENYSGAGDPTLATWQEVPGVSGQLPAKGSGSYKKIAAELIALTGKKVFIGLQYVGASSTSSASFEIDNFSVSEEGAGFEFNFLPFSDDLNACGDFNIPATFIQERVAGSKQDRGWECSANGVTGSQSVTATALGGVAGAVDSWLISAKAFDFTAITAGTLTFDIQSRTNGSGQLLILWSEDYTGTGDPSSAIWSEYTGFTLPAGGTATYEAVEVDLADAIGTTPYIAFQFVGATNSSSISYDIDNINVAAGSGTGGGNQALFENFNDCNALNSFTAFSVIGDQIWDCTTFGIDETTAAQISGFSGSALDNEDWLITPAITISASSTLSFDARTKFAGLKIKIRISSDYSGTGNPSSATWTDLTVALPNIDSDIWTPVTPVDLSAFSGDNRYVAFVYFSNPTDGAPRWTLENVKVTE